MYQMLPSNMMYPFMFSLLSMMILLSTFFFFLKSEKKKFLKEKSKSSMEGKKLNILGLFISFDSHSSMSIFWMKELNWLIILFISIFMVFSFWSKPNRLTFFLKNFNKNVSNQFSIALKTKKDGSSFLFVCLFMFFLYCNMVGLSPNLFTSTSHMSMNILFSLTLWMGFMLYGWYNFTNKMFAHLVPMGTPIVLMSFMVIIELVSNLIRPGTLSIRLMANMVSGHLLLILLGNKMQESIIMVMIMMLLIQMLLMMLEMAVSIIQAYVFCMLLTLYSDESEYKKEL